MKKFFCNFYKYTFGDPKSRGEMLSKARFSSIRHQRLVPHPEGKSVKLLLYW